jgi:hypothetical protein
MSLVTLVRLISLEKYPFCRIMAVFFSSRQSDQVLGLYDAGVWKADWQTILDRETWQAIPSKAQPSPRFGLIQ